MIFEENSCIVSSFIAFDTCDFKKVGCRIDAGEDIEFHIDVIDSYVPRTNELDVYFGPRKKRSLVRSSLSSRIS